MGLLNWNRYPYRGRGGLSHFSTLASWRCYPYQGQSYAKPYPWPRGLGKFQSWGCYPYLGLGGWPHEVYCIDKLASCSGLGAWGGLKLDVVLNV